MATPILFRSYAPLGLLIQIMRLPQPQPYTKDSAEPFNLRLPISATSLPGNGFLPQCFPPILRSPLILKFSDHSAPASASNTPLGLTAPKETQAVLEQLR